MRQPEYFKKLKVRFSVEDVVSDNKTLTTTARPSLWSFFMDEIQCHITELPKIKLWERKLGYWDRCSFCDLQEIPFLNKTLISDHSAENILGIEACNKLSGNKLNQQLTFWKFPLNLFDLFHKKEGEKTYFLPFYSWFGCSSNISRNCK